MVNPVNVTFNLLEEKSGYGIYYAIPVGHIKTGNEQTIMIVLKDNKIVYNPTDSSDEKLSQFKMKRMCDNFIEERMKK